MPSLPDTLAGVILAALTAYVLLGGADFGGGVWDLLASGPRQARQRDLIAHAIGPVWEANHVWLILAIVLLFTCFPRAFATVAVGLHVPLTLMLIGARLGGPCELNFILRREQREARNVSEVHADQVPVARRRAATRSVMPSPGIPSE